MEMQNNVTEIIYGALRALNEELPEDKKVTIATDTKLFGPEASLDSLSLVSVIVDVESAVSDRYGTAISLTDDEALTQEVSPFSSVNTLAAYVVSLLTRG